VQDCKVSQIGGVMLPQNSREDFPSSEKTVPLVHRWQKALHEHQQRQRHAVPFTENPTDEDILLWREIFQTHADAMGKKTKAKSENQIRKWLQSPHSDSAEYKMWGNGVALPNVVFVLSGIVYYAQQ